MRTAGLFAGVGGLEQGLAKAGHETVFLSEIWAPASAVLRQRFRSAELAGDVRDVRELPHDVEILTAGFPCQDLSQAGRTAGIGGLRSGLVGEVFRLLDRSSPTYVVLENVSFMLSLDGGQAMSILVNEFENRGYRWAYRVVNTLAFLPHRRERVFFVASKTEDPSAVLFADQAHIPQPTTALRTHGHGFYWTEGIRGLGWAPDAVPTLKNGSTVGIASPPAILLPDGRIVTPDIRDAERLQGFGPDWTAPAETVDRRNWRWSLVGNAVSVPVAAWLGRRLISPGAMLADTMPMSEARRWPKAARGERGRRDIVLISDAPVFLPRDPIAAFLRYPPKLLSARASLGFLSRTQKSKLRFVEGFLAAVEAHANAVLASDPAAFRIAAE